MSTQYNYNSPNTQANQTGVRSGSYMTPSQDEVVKKYLNMQPNDPTYQRSTLAVNQNIDQRQFLFTSAGPASYNTSTYSNLQPVQTNNASTTPYVSSNTTTTAYVPSTTYTPSTTSGLYSTQPAYLPSSNVSYTYGTKEPGENLYQYSKLANVQVKEVQTPVKTYDDQDQVKRAAKKNEPPVGTYTSSQYITTPGYQTTTTTTTGYNAGGYQPQSSSTITKSQLVINEDAGQAVLLRSSTLAQVNAVPRHELKSIQDQNITMCNIF